MKNKTLKKSISFLVSLLMLLNTSLVVLGAEKIVDTKMYWSDDLTTWNDAENSGAIFDIADFEPGAEEIKYIKIENAGDLAFSYNLDFTTEQDKTLADTIDVYYSENITETKSVSDMSPLGTLADLIGGNSVSTGKILPNDLTGDGFYTNETVVAVALKMKDNASVDYMDKTLATFDIKLTATECEYDGYPSVDKFEVKLPEADFLYRVGNQNAVKLGSIFKALDNADIGNVTAKIEPLDSATNVSGTFAPNATWQNSTIQFVGTGPVKVTIDDDDFANELSVNLEVIDAKNVTAYGEIDTYKNNILLNDIKMSSNSSLYLRPGSIIHGNGFTFDVTQGKHGDTTSGYIGGNYVVCLDNAHLDNIKLVGAVYTTYGATAKSDYNFPNILSKGNSTIKNSYISNCASPVRVQNGVLEIKDTTLKGGNFANLDIREADKVILDNVTTINQVNSNDTATDGTIVVGLGVLVWYENVLSSQIEVRNGITQYNHLSETQANTYVKDSTVKGLINQMYGSSLSSIQYNDGSEKWVNTGILSATSAVGEGNITGVDNFIAQSVSAYSVKGYLRTQKPSAEIITETAPTWKAEKQSAIAPTATFNHDKNNQAQTSDSNEFCYYNSDLNKVLVSFDDGGSKQYSLDIFSAQKGGTELDYTVTLNGETYSENTITFDQTKDYVVEYTYTDPYNYELDSNGNIVKKNITYTKKLEISVNEVPKAAKNAEFTFYGYSSISKTPAVTITDVKTVTSNSGKTYIMPATTGTYVTSKTIDGITVNCPKVYVDFKNNSSDFNWLYPVFLGVDITDYKDGGAGDAENIVTHNSQDTKPANLSILTTDKPTGGGGWSSGSGKSGSEGKLSSGTYKNLYGWTSGAIGSDQSANSIYAEFSYKDNKGTVYYYCIEFYRDAHDCPSTCVTPDTLITLADGTQKRIDEVTYEDSILVWDFVDGEYKAMPPAILYNHGYDNYRVTTLNFSDGSVVKIIGDHGFFNSSSNEFIMINEGNVLDYIGEEFLKYNGTSFESVTLDSYSIKEEYTGSYSILTTIHYNCILGNMFTLSPNVIGGNYFMPFEIGEDLKFDSEKRQADIEKYGLFTYEELSDYVTEEQFYALNAPQVKVAIGKGIITMDELMQIIDTLIPKSNTTPDNAPIVNVYEPETLTMAINTEEPAIMLLSDIVENVKSDIITSTSNKIKTASYAVENAVENNVITLSATGTASTGYAKITVDGEIFYTVQIPQGESINVTLKNTENAKDFTVTVESFWGNSANYEVSQEELLANDSEIDFGTVTLTVSGASAILSNTTKYPVTGDVYIAVYNGNSLITVKKQNITVEGKNDFTYSPEITVPENATVKAFIWETGSMKPTL